LARHNKYTYYHCTGYKGKCAFPYMREEEVGQRLGQVLKDIHIPDDVLAQLEKSLTDADRSSRQEKKRQQVQLEQRLTAVRRRIDQAYMDKLDVNISEEYWRRKTTEWQLEEQQIQMAMHGLQEATPDQLLSAKRTLELANTAYFLYVTQDPAEQAKLLKMVLSNCRIDGVSPYPSYRKPFDLIFQRAKTKEWRARQDSNLRPSA
jgi:site-specific DNA recombinase